MALYTYGLDTHGLHSYGLHSYGLYSDGADIPAENDVICRRVCGPDPLCIAMEPVHPVCIGMCVAAAITI